MTLEDARCLFLSLEAAEEEQHHGHPDFRVSGKIFATLQPAKDKAALRLPLSLAESIAAESDHARIVSKSGEIVWLAIDLSVAEPKSLHSWAKIAHAVRLAPKTGS